MNLHYLLDPRILALILPGVAVVCGTGLAAVAIFLKHRERMAMIEHGMDPDATKRSSREQIQAPQEVYRPERR